MPYPDNHFLPRQPAPTAPIGAHNVPVYRSDLGQGRVTFPFVEARSVDLSLGDRVVDLFTIPAGCWILLHGHRIYGSGGDDEGDLSLIDAFSAVQATGTVAFSNAPSAGDTVTINGIVYTFVVTPAVAGDVKIGATAAATAQNLAAAINTGAGAGTNYGILTVTNPYVKASVSTATVLLTAAPFGADGNALTLAKSGSNITVSDTTFADGSDGSALISGIDGTTNAIAYDGGVRTNAGHVAIVTTDPMRLKARVAGSGVAPVGYCTFFVMMINPNGWDGLALIV